MSESENRIPGSSEMEELKEQLDAMRSQVTALLLALVVVSGTLSVYLFVQARHARNDLLTFRPVATQVNNQARREEPILRGFLTKLNEYGRTHADFMPILSKYKFQFPTSAATATTSVPPANPAPNPAAPAKK